VRSIKARAPRNRTLTLSDAEHDYYRPRLLRLEQPVSPEMILNRTICQDLFDALPHLPNAFVDLLIIDPPYNLRKSFGEQSFQGGSDEEYYAWGESWLIPLLRTLKPTATVYVCGDWRSSPILYQLLKQHLIVRNRITWEREKGRGSQVNWKNASEDIWFCTVSQQYTFNVEAVKLRRRVLAPYRTDGQPKDWQEDADGKTRLTYPSNLWTDISVPFWSMPENTDHPTQKPEKLIAKLILASSNLGDVVLDPFAGSGTTVVVAKKLGRQFIGIEIDETYACLGEKRLDIAEGDSKIQGYADGVFWERNSRK
jgi:site-specific DNA-methyltransferase (adenine-specific)